VGTLLTDIGKGNRVEAKGGVSGVYDNFQLQLNALWREPLIGPIEDPQISLKNPFYVGENREALRFEAVLSYDGEPATWIWAWNGNDTEGAFIAASLSANYSVYEGATDPGSYLDGEGIRRWFTQGLPRAEGVFSIALRTVFNPLANLRIVNIAEVSRAQPGNGDLSKSNPDRPVVTGFQDTLKMRFRRLLFSSLLAFDRWGPESYQKELGATYPMRWAFEVGRSFKHRPSLVNSEDRVALRWNGVIRDRYSANWQKYGKDSQELVLYFNINF
jgi:hypothetical protein